MLRAWRLRGSSEPMGGSFRSRCSMAGGNEGRAPTFQPAQSFLFLRTQRIAMKKKTETRMVAKDWDKILPVKGPPKMKHVKGGEDWMFEALGWKKR